MDKNSELWNDKQYEEIMDYVEALYISRLLTDVKVICGTHTDSTGHDILSYRVYNKRNRHVQSMFYNVGFEITLKKSNTIEFHVWFKDDKFNTSGMKGNLKNEGFNYNATNNAGYLDYKFILDQENSTKKVIRLFRYFRKYI